MPVTRGSALLARIMPAGISGRAGIIIIRSSTPSRRGRGITASIEGTGMVMPDPTGTIIMDERYTAAACRTAVRPTSRTSGPQTVLNGTQIGVTSLGKWIVWALPVTTFGRLTPR